MVVPSGLVQKYAKPLPKLGVFKVKEPPWQTESSPLMIGAGGRGLIIMVIEVSLLHPLAVAVIVNVVDCELDDVFVSVPDMVFPLPEEGMPVRLSVFVLVQV